MTTPNSAAATLAVLHHKRDAELSHGAFSRYEPIPLADRSRYSSADPAARVELGLGYVQAILAALHGVVTSFSYDPPGFAGRLAHRSTGSSAFYRLSWRDRDGALALGGFAHSDSRPTYQVALAVLVQAICRRHAGHLAGVDELVERWFALVQAMELSFPRSDASIGWSREALAAAGVLPAIRSRIMQVCDALRVTLTYRLPDLTHRGLLLHAGDVVPAGDGNRVVMLGSLLLNPSGLTLPPPASPAEPAAPSPPPSAAAPAKRTRRSRSTAKPTVPPEAPPTVEPANDGAEQLFGAHIGRIELALRRGGPVMLIGPTATGKTTQALAAAFRLGYGVEAVTLDEGWEADDLFGSYTRTQHDHEWRFVPGPVTRWAERAAGGESVVLLLDELARGHKTVISAVMRLMNEHPRSAVEGMKLPLPDDAGPFHIVDIRATQQRIVLPCARVRIVATANQGEGYGGIDLSDPAFGRRFHGGWLHLTGYPADEAARILGDKLGLAPSAPLIRAMQQVEVQVLAYQKKEESLRATLDLATLIAWGRTARDLFDHATTPARGNAPLAFQEAARDVWLDRICPLQGADLDPQVERALLEMVLAASASLR